ncbi:lysozyme inhibitor LprI family protein [Flaviaesturariibacter aridisoli]|uniref:lysozyme inhibitor LprI family protein n=1 Tax=Flaviaesturariibacter aridisoli TaxID=2545761 RepID=UPI00140469E8|nr:lysozyme inhibitor LprI family protein [Flaviaesturariibacter aridisoli]
MTRFRAELVAARENPAAIEFSVDTFRLELAYRKVVEKAKSDFDMSEATDALAHGYDSLMNKYYRKLAAVLQGSDKQTLVAAQKAWLAFRDAEGKLSRTVSQSEYSGGGTMQGLVESQEYLLLVRSRTTALFDHYARATQSY